MSWRKRLNFLLNLIVSLELTSEISKIEDGYLRHVMSDGVSSLRPSGNKLLKRRVIVISDDRNGVAGDTLTSHSGCPLLEAIDGLANRDTIRDVLFELFASLCHIGGDCEFEHTEVFDAKSFLEVALRVNRDQFVLLVQVVELDWPDSFEAVTEGVPGLERESFIMAGHAKTFGFPLETHFDTLFGRHFFSCFRF